MRNVVFGGIGVLWGGAILLYGWLSGAPKAGGAFGAGQTVGTIFGVLLLGVGLFYLVNGLRSRDLFGGKRRPKKRRRKPRADDRDDVEDDEESDAPPSAADMDKLTTPCPGCNKSLRLPAAAAGRRVRCPGCGHTFAAPAAGRA